MDGRTRYKLQTLAEELVRRVLPKKEGEYQAATIEVLTKVVTAAALVTIAEELEFLRDDIREISGKTVGR